MQASANVNGIITPYSEAKISIADRGFLYGDSIYEVVRTYSGVPFCAKEHFDRMENSARLAHITISQSREFLEQEIIKTVRASGVKRGEDVFIRYTITRGEGPLDLDPSTAKKTSFVILVKEIPNWNPQFFIAGVKLAIPSVRRNAPLSLDPNIKSGNYLNNILAIAEAKNLGADDALILSLEGKLTESSNSNISFVIDGEIHSPVHEPQTTTGNLRGITKKIIEKLCSNLGIRYVERVMLPEDIERASEGIISSATREVMPMAGVKLESGTWKNFPANTRKITESLQKEYKKYIAEYSQQHANEAYF